MLNQTCGPHIGFPFANIDIREPQHDFIGYKQGARLQLTVFDDLPEHGQLGPEVQVRV
jgi:hypothetical protein